MQQKTLLIIGSPKRSESTSAALGNYLIGKLTQEHFETETIYIYTSLKTQQEKDRFVTAFDGAGIVIMTFPLYADSPPSGVIRAMEVITEQRKAKDFTANQKLMAIVNCGFPEALHNETCLAICRKFASEAGMEWLGGLSLGGGGAIDGKPLDAAGGMVRNVKKSLDLAASDMAGGRTISGEAVELMARSMMPVWLYIMGGNWGMKSRARKNRALRRINDCPYR